MAKRKKPDERRKAWIDDLDNEFRQDILYGESERGAVLVAVGFIEEALEHVIRGRFKMLSEADDKLLDKMLIDLPAAPLSTLSARVRIAFLIGVIPKAQHDVLLEMASLRNEFAHRSYKGQKPKLSRDAVADWTSRLMPEGAHYDMAKLVPENEMLGNVNVTRLQFGYLVWEILEALRRAEEEMLSRTKPTPSRSFSTSVSTTSTVSQRINPN